MRKSILFLFLIWVLGAASTEHSRAASPEATESTGKKTTSAPSQPIEEPPFIFSRRNRRDPFSPLFGGGQETGEAADVIKCTEQDIEEGRRALADLTVACKNRNAGQFNTIYEQIIKKLDRPCESDDILIHALELKRRARNLKYAMSDYERSIGWERELQWAEGQLQEMQKEALAGNLDALRRRYQEVKSRINAHLSDVDDPRYQKRMREIVSECAQVLAKHITDLQKEDIDAAEKRINKMKELLRKGSYSSVHTEFDELMTMIQDWKFEDPALQNKLEKIRLTALDINKQAEIGEVKQMLSTAKDFLGQMESTFNASDYGAIAEMNVKLQQDLANIPSVEAELDQEKAAYKTKGMDLERRAKICIEFLQAPIKISGIGWHPQNPVAIINDRTVGLGDYINENTRVKSITPETVVFNYKGESIERPMRGG